MTTVFEQFIFNCENGNLQMAQFLFCKFKTEHNTSILNEPEIKEDKLFYRVCKRGCIDVAEWLISVNPDFVYLTKKGFICACSNGQKDMAEWLLQFKKVNVRVYSKSFNKACERGHLNVAQWLYNRISYNKTQVECLITNTERVDMKKLYNLAVTNGCDDLAVRLSNIGGVIMWERGSNGRLNKVYSMV